MLPNHVESNGLLPHCKVQNFEFVAIGIATDFDMNSSCLQDRSYSKYFVQDLWYNFVKLQIL